MKQVEAEIKESGVELWEAPAKTYEDYLRRACRLQGMKHVLDLLNEVHGGKE
jgi:hypothetical protein